MNYSETINYLYSQMPMFEKHGAAGYKAGLQNTLALDEHFGHPHQHYNTIHIAGTNGKGSCSHTIAAILQTAGYKVGLYTSPHLVDFRERIRVNGKMMSKDYVVDFVEEERSFFEPLHPSFFEVTTALAFKYFEDQDIDIAVVEVGLGGRIDCTNIITPLLSIITNISFDHTQFLGNTLAAIAGEKAGIIKSGIPIVIGEANDETRHVFMAKAREMNAPITFAEDEPEVLKATPCNTGGMDYETVHFGHLHGDLGGIYQQKNMNTVLKALLNEELRMKNEEWRQLGSCAFIPNISTALNNVCKLTGLMGRWQTVRQEPLVICDTGHNVGGWEYLGKQVTGVKCKQRRIVFGMVADKDIDGVLCLLPKDAIYYFTKPDNKRAMSETEMMEKASLHGLKGSSYSTVSKAYKQALNDASKDDFIFVGGSSYVVADFLSANV